MKLNSSIHVHFFKKNDKIGYKLARKVSGVSSVVETSNLLGTLEQIIG